MSGARVGIRQWTMLVALEALDGASMSMSDARAALRVPSPGDYGAGVAEGLIVSGLVRHACPVDDHKPGVTCQVAITESGSQARLTRRAMRIASQRARG